MAAVVENTPQLLSQRTPSNESFDEKKDVEAGVTVDETVVEPYDNLSGEPLPLVDSTLPEEEQTLTFRAVIVGCALGSVVQASNLYLGLKTGFTFGPQLFGAILGFAICKIISRSLPTFLGGGYFGEKENVTVQTAATAAGGLGIIYVSGIPAMYQLGLLGATPKDDFGRLIAFTLSLAFFGMAFAVPLRRWYVLKQKLVFPTPTATALTIRSMHASGSGAAVAAKKTRALVGTFCGAVTLRVTSGYAPGVLWDWHPFWWLSSWGWTKVLYADNWGFFWENTPAFLGAGVLSGVNASLSLYFGGVFCWGILGPLLIKYGNAVGRDFTEDYNGAPVFNYNKMSFTDPKHNVSPRYWVLWSGIMIMLIASFVEIFCQAPVVFKAFKGVYANTANAISRARGQDEKHEVEVAIEDPARKEDQVPWWAWAFALVVSAVLNIVIMSKLFDVNAGISILSIFLGFLFSFIGVQCAGSTDINPISTCAKASQLVVAGPAIKQSPGVAGQSLNAGAARISLLAGLVAGGASAQATDMTGDMKTGHLLRCKPRNQFVAQAAGALCSVFLSTGLFVLFNIAYPCITDANADTCAFGIPSVSAWAGVALATTGKNGLPMPNGAAIAALLFGIATAGLVVAKHFAPANLKQYMPNMLAFGLAFVLPPGNSQYGLAMAVGSLASWGIQKKFPKAHELYVYPVAAGGIAGEGIGGIINAVLTIAGVDGSVYGTAAGCPGNVFCG